MLALPVTLRLIVIWLSLSVGSNSMRSVCSVGYLPLFPQAPVFLLFLDCVWQLLSQYPSHFQLTADFLLALHDSIHLPLFSSFMANCQRERCKRSQVKVFSDVGKVERRGWTDPNPPY